jgi:Lrp/AsnC family transcriptional regulator
MILDDTDRRILRAWQAHPDAKVADIAERVGLSHTPCWRRMRKLEAAGIVRGQSLVLDAKLLDLEVNVFARLRLRQHDEETLEALEAATRACPEIVECFSMTGESDYLVRVIVRNVEGYEVFLKKTLLHLPGVASVDSSFALKCVKMTSVLPI